MSGDPLAEAEWGGEVDRARVHNARGWRCITCGAVLDIATPCPWRCPNATATDRRHLLRIVDAGERIVPPGIANSFVNHDADLAWAAFAAAHGMTSLARHRLVADVDDLVREVDGTAFRRTPFARSESLSRELGFTDGGVWVKDETGGVAGSQKARHLVTILLHLLAAEQLGLLDGRPPLAIASCGNAALAAATLARATRWPIDVYVPTWMSEAYGKRLEDLGATIHRCERRDDDPAGDPSMFRFREAVAAGAVPFTVQGPENALCLDGGRTIGWEICEQLREAGVEALDRTFVQVGGGAFATCLSDGYTNRCGAMRLHAVQTEGCAPLARAWDRADGRTELAQDWAELMTVWESPHSVADGILDDETYDWIPIVEAMRSGGGYPVVAPESLVVEAHEIAQRAGFDVSPTGSAGLAGLLQIRGEIGDDEHVCVVMSGVRR